MHHFVSEGLYQPPRAMSSTIYDEWINFLGFKSSPPFTDIVKLGKKQDFFLHNSDCIRQKEESHIHLGWLEGQ